ncbi:lamin tail domain-containing protein [Nocardioides sp. 1609]|uniref:metallophosphoesterase n=1 Tax=Nocardioides sp. 1609 TaxID=2508327 RepID=UPI00106F4106|nr:lamin tail domain-containing protein [Nocardioides sp. 1609]
MPVSHRSFARPLVAAAVGAALTAGVLAVVAPPAATAAVPPPSLMITEVNVNSGNQPGSDGASLDAWEFVEVHNTTNAAIDLTAADVAVVYLSGSTPRTLAYEPGTVVPAHGTVVLWAKNSRYRDATSEGGTDARLTDEQFRAFYAGLGAGTDYALAHLTGQDGLNNTGTSMYLTQGGVEVSRITWAAADVGSDQTVTYGVPAAAGSTQLAVFAQRQVPTPGTVDPAQVGAVADPPTDPPAEPGVAPSLVVTEIAPDLTGDDTYEFFEVANTTSAPIDVSQGYGFSYIFSDTGTSANDKVLTISDAAVTIPARGVALVWLQYASGNVDSFARTDAEFRAAVGAPADALVLHATGQPGMANGGNRGIRVDAGGTPLTWSFLPARTATAMASTHFGVPAAGGGLTRVTADLAPFTAGVVDPAQLVPPATEPPEEPGGPDVPDQGPPPPTDPTLSAPLLQVTEVAPDTTNVGTGDGYEFVEVYNASDEPVDFADYTINYLYTDANEVTTSSALWPAVPADPVIEPGRTLVLWVKNAQNAALGAADFNAHFGAHLTAGVDLVEMVSGGMANAGLRGIQVLTNSGHDISRAYYLDDADTVADQPLQYRWESGTRQTKIGTATATPGYAAPTQVPAGLVPTPVDTTGPVVADLTGSTDAPDTDGLALDFRVTDDHLVRTVELTTDTDVDEPSSRFLRFGAPDRYAYEIPAVDLYGKRWVEYTLRTTDGVTTTTFGPVRVVLDEGAPAPVRLNVADDQYVGGTTRLSATTDADPAGLALTVDGAPVAPLVPALEDAPVFAFEATNTDAFFRNGVRMGDDVLAVFDEGLYERIETITAPVPIERAVRGEELTVGIYAGTKAFPQPDPNENNDDFSALNLRLALPDGRVLRPVRCGGAGEGQAETVRACPADPATRIGFSDASQVYFTATFALPDDAFDSVAHAWDTTAVADGAHAVTATSGAESVTRTVRVDNTAPSVSSSLTDGRRYRGEVVVDATATDAGAGLGPDAVTATLDGEPVTLPSTTSSLELAPGPHRVVITARDRVGNEVTRTIDFTTADERPDTTLQAPEDGAVVDAGGVELRATAGSPEGDELTMAFREGHTFVPTDAEVGAYAGSTDDAASLDRDDRVVLSDAELAEVAGTDGISHEVSSETELPYQLFTVAVPADAGADASVRLRWDGAANAGAKVLLYVRDSASGAWEEVARTVTTDAEPFVLEATVPTAGHVVDGEVTVLVQHSEGFAGTPGSSRESNPTPYADAATPRSEYDFTIGWQSDTQYYNETQDFYKHQLAINRFLLDQREELNLQYVIHTGDIVNVAREQRQWENADSAYRPLDAAGLPYGVLAGNHDVSGAEEDYTEYSRWFGEDRYAANPWYGGSLQDNRGHYDLVSAHGVDFLMLYMGWGPGDEQIDWMNEVIARYPERKVWINLHEFMLTTGGLGPIPQRIQDEVVATNPNVFAVSSGHYHDAFTRTDEFDDDGDGTADRTVYSMLFDYQGLPEGGLGYLRLLHFDNEGGRIVVRTYSPSLDDFDSDDPSLAPEHQEFEIPYAAAGIAPVTKTLATDSFRADVLTTTDIEVLRDVPSGATRTVTWDVEPGEHGWYVETTGPFGGTDVSEVRTVTVEAPGAPTPGTPRIRGTARVGQLVTAEPGRWPAGRSLTYRWLASGRPVAGATGRTLRLGPQLVGTRLTVEVTGRGSGSSSSTAVSAARTVVPGRLVSRRPVLRGRPVVGRVLTVRTGRWGPAPVDLRVRWYVAGRLVRGVAATRLTVRPAFRGQRITVRVTGTKDGYASRTVTSDPTTKVVRRR